MKKHIKHLKTIAAALLFIAVSYGNSNAQSAAITFLPATVETEVGQSFFVEVVFDTDNTPISVFDLHMLFDANYLEVLSIESLQGDLYNYHQSPVFDNSTGKMDMAAFQIGKAIPATFSVIKIELMPLAVTQLTEVVQNTTGFPKTLLAYGGMDVLGTTGTLKVTITDSAVGIDNAVETHEFGLEIWPNPSSNFANISFHVKQTGQVDLDIYDEGGKLVEKVFSGEVRPGAAKKFEVDLSRFASGSYTCRILSDQKVQTEKLNVIK